MKNNSQKYFDNKCRIYNITYTSGAGEQARTHRYQIGQYLKAIDAYVYSITEEIIGGGSLPYLKRIFRVNIINSETMEITTYKETENTPQDITYNQKYMFSDEI